MVYSDTGVPMEHLPSGSVVTAIESSMPSNDGQPSSAGTGPHYHYVAMGDGNPPTYATLESASGLSSFGPIPYQDNSYNYMP